MKTIASKNRTSLVKTRKRLEAPLKTKEGPRKGIQLTMEREGKKPLVAIFGGLPLKRKDTAGKDQVILPYIRTRSEIVERLVKSACEVCGAKEHGERHHIRTLADLNKQGRRAD